MVRQADFGADGLAASLARPGGNIIARNKAAPNIEGEIFPAAQPFWRSERSYQRLAEAAEGAGG
jgi:hypothetical protein